MMQAIVFKFPSISNVRCVFQYRSRTSKQHLAGTTEDALALQESWQVTEYNSAEYTYKAREIFCEQYAIPAYAMVHQVHGTKTIFEPNQWHRDIVLQQADAMATRRVGLGLAIVTADCQSIGIVDKNGEALLALHVGWRANRAGFIASAVQSFCTQYKLQPADLFVVRGASLSPQCARFTSFATEWGEAFLPWYNPTTQCMNLWQLTKDQCIACGIPQEQIFSLDLCTYSGAYFSYRRNKTLGRQCTILIKDAEV